MIPAVVVIVAAVATSVPPPVRRVAPPSLTNPNPHAQATIPGSHRAVVVIAAAVATSVPSPVTGVAPPSHLPSTPRSIPRTHQGPQAPNPASHPQSVARAYQGPQALSAAISPQALSAAHHLASAVTGPLAARAVAVAIHLLPATAVAGLLVVTVANRRHLVGASLVAIMIAVAVTRLTHLATSVVDPLLRAITTSMTNPLAMGIEAGRRPQAASPPQKAVTIVITLGPRGPPTLPLEMSDPTPAGSVYSRARVHGITITARQVDMVHLASPLAPGTPRPMKLNPPPSTAIKARPHSSGEAKLCSTTLGPRRRKAATWW